MDGRPWLEALKRRVTEEASRGPGYELAKPHHPMGGALTKPTKPSGREPDTARNVTNASTSRAESTSGGDESRLLAAGWTPKIRCGLTIWENPDTGFYYSQEVALLRRGERTDGARHSVKERFDPRKRARHGL